MSPIPLAQKVLTMLAPLAGTDCLPAPEAASKAKESLAMCNDGEECLALFGHVAANITYSLHGIHNAIQNGHLSILAFEYPKFCDAVSTFFCMFYETNNWAARMLYINWQKQDSIRRLADCIKEALEGTLRLVADINDDTWHKANSQLHTILHKINVMIDTLRDTIMAKTTVNDNDFKYLRAEYDLYLKRKMALLESTFTSQWNNNKRCMDDNMTGQTLKDRILENKPHDNILIDKDKYGDTSIDAMVVFIITNRERLTVKIIDEYFTYRAKWKLLRDYTAILGVIIVIKPTQSFSDEDLRSPLASYILDKEILRRVIFACRTCTSTSMVYDRVICLLKQSPIYDKERMTREKFLATLIPYLDITPKPTPTALYQAIYKQM